MQAQALASIMVRPVATVDLGASMAEVAEVLAANEIGAVVVTRGSGHAVGIVTEHDVVAHVAAGANPGHLTAGEMVSTGLITVGPHESPTDAARIMVDAVVRHLPVFSDSGELLGMISARDILAALIATD